MNKEEIDQIVDGLVEVVGSRNLKDIVEHLGIKVIKTDKDESLFVRTSKDDFIFLSQKETEEYQPFVLAHEIGHAVLHDVEILYFSKLTTTKSRYELEADYFAFKLLDKKIEKSLNYTTKEYAKDLCVSEKVVRYVIDK